MEVGRIDDPIVRDRLTQTAGFVLSHRYSSYRIFSCAAAGADAGAVPLMLKSLLTEIGHDMALLAQDLIGEHGFVEPAGASGRGHPGPPRHATSLGSAPVRDSAPHSVQL